MPYPENKEFKIVSKKLDTWLQKGLPFVAYRKPGQEEINAVFQKDDTLHNTFEFGERGFVMAPFDFKGKAILIKPDELLTSPLRTPITTNFKPAIVSDGDKSKHIDLIKKGIDRIKKRELKKVVLSRKFEVQVTAGPIVIFQRLLEHYPNAFCYVFHHPKVGMWCGATPETLLQIKGNHLRTMSLAATLPYVLDENPIWGKKEIEEQQLVSDYIKDQLDSHVETLQVGVAESIRAGNLWHLRSEISGTLSSDNKIRNAISALHPTPAVCGIPTHVAKSFILEHENYNRSFYTGFLGEVNLTKKDETSLFVNLRCVELLADRAVVFVGGGITLASEPESEWMETQNKSKTMLNIL